MNKELTRQVTKGVSLNDLLPLYNEIKAIHEELSQIHKQMRG